MAAQDASCASAVDAANIVACKKCKVMISAAQDSCPLCGTNDPHTD